MALPKVAPTPRNAPVAIVKMGMGAAEADAERARMVKECLDRAAQQTTSGGPKNDHPNLIQGPLLGLPRTGIQHAPAFKPAARRTAIIGRVDLGTAQAMPGEDPASLGKYPLARMRKNKHHKSVRARYEVRGRRSALAMARAAAIDHGHTLGYLPGEHAVLQERAGNLALGIEYDSTREQSTSGITRTGHAQPLAPKVRADIERANGSRADLAWQCSYSEHTVTYTNPDDIMHVIRELMASSHVLAVTVGADDGGFSLTQDGWGWIKTGTAKRLTRIQWASAMSTPKGDVYKRVVRQATQPLNYNRTTLWSKASTSRGTFSAG